MANKQTVALIALFAGWILAADIASATTYEDIAGQWCGDVTDYVFAPKTLTVKFHDNRPNNVFKITKYTYANNSVGSTEPKSRSRFFPLTPGEVLRQSAKLLIGSATGGWLVRHIRM